MQQIAAQHGALRSGWERQARGVACDAQASAAQHGARSIDVEVRPDVAPRDDVVAQAERPALAGAHLQHGPALDDEGVVDGALVLAHRRSGPRIQRARSWSAAAKRASCHRLKYPSSLIVRA